MPLAEDEGAGPTPASAWGGPAKVGFIVELPSGNKARVKRTLDLPTMLKTGRIPNPLSKIVQDMIGKQTNIFPTDEMNMEIIGQIMMLVDLSATKVMIEPKCENPPPQEPNEDAEVYEARRAAWKPSEGAVSTEWLSMEDKVFLFSVGQGMAVDLESFRSVSAGALQPVEASESVEMQTVDAGGA